MVRVHLSLVMVCGTMVVTSALFSSGCATTSTTGLAAPAELRCEYRPSPMGIDVTAPRLGWQVQDSRRGAWQQAYQIVVSTDPTMQDAAAIVWDSGKVASDESVQVAYAGKPLASGTRYYWQVRTWDNDGVASPYSAPAWWEMGLLEAADWKARWISAPPPPPAPTLPVLDGAKWVWNAAAEGDKKDAWFRKTFTLPIDTHVAEAQVSVTADNGFILYINGQEVGHYDVWNNVKTYDVSQRVQPGNNVIALKCWNGDGAAGLLLSLRVTLAGGKTIDLKTDDSWKTSPAEATQWNETTFDDAAWQGVKTIANYGDAPWNELKEKPGPRRSFSLRKEFKAKSDIRRARVHVTGLGLYKLYINGETIGEDILSPGWTDYRKRVQYQTYDVTDLLQAGDNAVGATLGNGWWSGGLGWASSDAYSQGNLRLLMQMRIEYADGSEDIVVTDDTWKAHISPITRDSIYNGETYDARLETPGWKSAGFDDANWTATLLVDDPQQQKVRIVADVCEPIRVTSELKPVWISEPQKGVFIVDFGQNAAGFCRLKIKGGPGTQIRLRFCEELDPSGRLYRDNYRTAEATDFYICKGQGEETWEPLFTYRGFRYCEITGCAERPTADTLTYRVFHSDVPPAGRFECSDLLINRIYDAVHWGQRSNIHSVPTDCPQRDERLGWTGDANVFGRTSCWNMQMAAFYTKWMQDLMDSQSPEGWVTDVAPAIVVGGPAAPGWGDAVVTTPWYVYQFYGDTRLLEKCYDAMVAWVEYMHSQRDGKSGLYERKGYGDWVATVESPKDTIGAAYYYYSTKLAGQMAAALGRTADADKYTKRAEEIAALFNKAYLNPDTNNYPGGTQTANLLPLYFGIVPADRQSAVLENIVKDIQQRGNHLSTGFLGTAYLMTSLADRGQQELAYKLATQTTCPSWGYMILNGATTMWERWDTDKWGPDMNSRNHYAFGAVVRWIYETLGGINPDPAAPGFKRIIIKPQPAGDLIWAKSSYASMYGHIATQWHRTDEGLTLKVTIPANTIASVHIPLLDATVYTIREGDTAVAANGHAAGHVPGAAFRAVEHGFAVLDVGAGTYTFTLRGE